jgi:hypothetical protein
MAIDAETERLISYLHLRAGMLMEDLSGAAISTLPAAPGDRQRRLRLLAIGGSAIGALTLGAWCLSELAEMRHSD